jgi:hypothetical protein
MSSRNRVRAAGILVLLSILTFAVPMEAAARDGGDAAFQPWARVQQWWAAWAGGWAKIGSGLDPSGGTLDAGSDLNPHGASLDEGADLDPHGRP